LIAPDLRRDGSGTVPPQNVTVIRRSIRRSDLATSVCGIGRRFSSDQFPDHARIMVQN
jgi:hypothetical protein